LNKVYLITPNNLDKKFYFFLPKVLATKKVKFLQLRCKKSSAVKIQNHIKKILPISKKYSVKLIINDNAWIANKFKNVGFHLGQKDLLNKKNKIIIKKKIYFGITCHNSLDLAKKAIKLKANYIAFGAFFSTKTKKTKYIAKKKILLKAKNFKTKIVAIGGITNQNYHELLENGADYIAVSSFVWKNKDFNPDQAIKLFK